MGNRVNVQLTSTNNKAQCTFYLHWNGGPESVNAFFNAVYDFMKSQGRTNDLEYFTARFAQAVGNYLGGATSFGINNGPLESNFNDNPSRSLDINTRASSEFKDESDQRKYQHIYQDCRGYLASTLGSYERKENDYQLAVDYLTRKLEELKQDAEKMYSIN